MKSRLKSKIDISIAGMRAWKSPWLPNREQMNQRHCKPEQNSNSKK